MNIVLRYSTWADVVGYIPRQQWLYFFNYGDRTIYLIFISVEGTPYQADSPLCGSQTGSHPPERMRPVSDNGGCDICFLKTWSWSPNSTDSNISSKKISVSYKWRRTCEIWPVTIWHTVFSLFYLTMVLLMFSWSEGPNSLISTLLLSHFNDC